MNARRPPERRSSIYAKSSSHNSEEDDTIWLISYADLMTLLFTFFVMLYSSSLVDNGTGLRRALSAFVQGTGSSNEVAQGDIAAQLQKRISEQIEQQQLASDVKVENKSDGLSITFSSSLLFDLGSSDLRSESQKVIKNIVTVLRQRAQSMKIRVEGFTDDNPVHGHHYRSNWELSGSRASRIVTLLEHEGFPADQLTMIGYGSSRPIAANRTPSGAPDVNGQRLNRRVVLTVYEIKPSSTPSK